MGASILQRRHRRSCPQMRQEIADMDQPLLSTELSIEVHQPTQGPFEGQSSVTIDNDSSFNNNDGDDADDWTSENEELKETSLEDKMHPASLRMNASRLGG
ncbi:MAG: hypothetical protein JOS17DRAFT_778269 [Linnemannia elongata]|nr:MAG: hypothetical protein JOS17DRAFT_778269 [Linnemannia elongata]